MSSALAAGFFTTEPPGKPYIHAHIIYIHVYRAFLVAQLVKNPHAIQETLVGILGQEDPLEKG